MAARGPYRFTGKHVWIIGASTGIGEALVHRLSRECGAIAISARSQEPLRALADQFAGGVAKVSVHTVDVTNADAVQETADAVRAEMGGIDVLLYCAGEWSSMDITAWDTPAFERQTDVNYTGLARAVASVLPEMLERRSGLIAGLSSATAYLPLPTAEAYGSSKAAVNYFLRNLRLDAATYNVRVVTVCPGFVRTRLTEKNRFRMPFMISSESAASTIVRGIERGRAEVHFPLRLTLPVKFLGWLPRPLSEWIVARIFRR